MSEGKNQLKEIKVDVFCPNCGFKFKHHIKISGKLIGGIGGMASGAIIGAKTGIAMGPLGAIAGTVPGAILGGIFGKGIGDKIDNPICSRCKTKFVLPKTIQNKIFTSIKSQEIKSVSQVSSEVNFLIKNNSFFEIAKKVVRLQERDQNNEANQIMSYLKNSNPSLFKKVNQIIQDLK